jgi:hypothetical protein
VAVKSGVGPAQVVRHDEHDVWFCRKGRAKQTKEREEMEEEVVRTKIHGYGGT